MCLYSKCVMGEVVRMIIWAGEQIREVENVRLNKGMKNEATLMKAAGWMSKAHLNEDEGPFRSYYWGSFIFNSDI